MNLGLNNRTSHPSSYTCHVLSVIAGIGTVGFFVNNVNNYNVIITV